MGYLKQAKDRLTTHNKPPSHEKKKDLPPIASNQAASGASGAATRWYDLETGEEVFDDCSCDLGLARDVKGVKSCEDGLVPIESLDPPAEVFRLVIESNEPLAGPVRLDEAQTSLNPAVTIAADLGSLRACVEEMNRGWAGTYEIAENAAQRAEVLIERLKACGCVAYVRS